MITAADSISQQRLDQFDHSQHVTSSVCDSRFLHVSLCNHVAVCVDTSQMWQRNELMCCLLLGADGGVDFDAVRVFEESKQSCTVKNKGKYDISYS